MTLYIRNMVCVRCEMVVKSELKNLGMNKALVELGEVKTNEYISSRQRQQLNTALQKSGFQLLDEQKSILIEKIKKIIIETVHYSEEQLKINLPDYLSKMLHYDYAFLDSIFLEVKNITIERFFIQHKIERVKELLVYYRLPFIEIAYQMNYPNVAQLSAQFKEITGFSLSGFQKIRNKREAVHENV